MGPVGDGLITLMDQKLSKLDDRLYELSSKMTSPKIKTPEKETEEQETKTKRIKVIQKSIHILRNQKRQRQNQLQFLQDQDNHLN